MSSPSYSSSSSSEEKNASMFRVFATGCNEWWQQQEDSGSSIRHETRREHLNRDRAAAHEALRNDYFNTPCVYTALEFKTRFRMSRELFLRILHDIEREVPWFTQRVDARGRVGFSTLQKCTAAIRYMAYGTASDMFGEYLKMSGRHIRSCVYKFSKAIVLLYRSRYLRKPMASEVEQLQAKHAEKHGFVGMLGNIDCTHWDWKNCPTAWHGQFARGDHPYPSIILEATGPDSSFELRGTLYKRGYYLADGIYPDYLTIVKSLSQPIGVKRQTYKNAHDAARKDIERAFGVLKSKWHIVDRPSKCFYQVKMRNIMYACVILHNMILEDNGLAICQHNPNEDAPMYEEINEDKKRRNRQEIRSREIHDALTADLIEYIHVRSSNR
ncbi:uncharacterized protein LOC143624702 [Bidens hawaiensis]|uniref:uncharacterized protein LOC143624702 n=1 Tax=Bidens hawaiensis TaxID=980011 RepID=UPI00404B9628